MNDGPVYEDEREQIDDLTQRLPLTSAHPDYVRLRGFLAIEKMLGLIYQVYSRKYQVAFSDPFELASRSWGGLSQSKLVLEKLSDQIEVEIGELQLGGTKFRGNQLLQMGTSLYGLTHKESVAAASRAEGAAQLKSMLEVVLKGIDVLRPYLRNENVSVGSLGDKLAVTMQSLYGATATRPFIEMTRELMDVRL